MNEYIPSPTQWVREQVQRYEETDGAEVNDLRGMSVVIVTNRGRRTGGIRKTPLMRVADGDGYVLIGSRGGAPEHPQWVHNLLAHPDVTIRDRARVTEMRVELIEEPVERTRLWALAVAAYPDYAEYQTRTERQIPVFAARPR